MYTPSLHSEAERGAGATFTVSQVGRLLDLTPALVLQYAEICRAELSPHPRGRLGRRFTRDDVDVISRARRAGRRHTVVVECAWCGKELGTRAGFTIAGVSHGMCLSCTEKFLADYQAREYPLGA